MVSQNWGKSQKTGKIEIFGLTAYGKIGKINKIEKRLWFKLSIACSWERMLQGG
jgi:hypothetical protein